MVFTAFEYKEYSDYEDLDDLLIINDSAVTVEASDIEEAQYNYLTYIYDVYNINGLLEITLHNKFIEYVVNYNKIEYPEALHDFVNRIEDISEKIFDEVIDDNGDYDEKFDEAMNLIYDKFNYDDSIYKLSDVDKKKLWYIIEPVNYKVISAPNIEEKWKKLFRSQIIEINNKEEYDSLIILCKYAKKNECEDFKITINDLTELGYDEINANNLLKLI